jgi:protocatechuate 3,4-dioxygenase, beta subunit
MKILGLLIIGLLVSCYPLQAPKVAEKNAPAKVTIAAKNEPGERLVVSGKVYREDGKTPLAGASLYVYHTDNRGYYSSETNDDNRNPRLRGYLRTDAQGRYEFDTIKPAHYPNNRIPAHIHYVVSAEGYRERVFEIVFTGDEHISEQIRASAASEDSAFSIRPLERDKQGVLHCTQNIRLKK